MIRVVQVGLGLWGRSWAEVVRDAEGAERAAVLHAMIRAIQSGEGPETDASDNLGSLAAMLGLVESIESGAPIEVGGWIGPEGTQP